MGVGPQTVLNSAQRHLISLKDGMEAAWLVEYRAGRVESYCTWFSMKKTTFSHKSCGHWP